MSVNALTSEPHKIKNPYKPKYTKTHYTTPKTNNPSDIFHTVLPSNTSTNNHHSTQDWKGQHYTTHNNKDILTIGFSNINGISSDSNNSLQTNLRDITATLHHHNITLLGISEHHLAMNNVKTKQKIYELERRIHKEIHTKFYLHSSQETTTNNKRLMGGTGIIALQQMIGRINPSKSGGDELGRWTYVNLHNPNGRSITVVSIYQVCQSPTTASP